MKSCKLIGIYEIIGGIWGLCMTFLNYLENQQCLFTMLFIFIPFGLTVLAGVLLFQRKIVGKQISIGIQLAQIFSFTYALKFIFCAGPEIAVSIGKSLEFSYVFILAQFAIGYSTSPTFFKINFIPIIILLIISFINLNKNKKRFT